MAEGQTDRRQTHVHCIQKEADGDWLQVSIGVGDNLQLLKVSTM